jgi:hypothetical protein
MQTDESMVLLYGTAMWAKLSDAQKSELRNHSQVSGLSQFLHGEHMA